MRYLLSAYGLIILLLLSACGLTQPPKDYSNGGDFILPPLEGDPYDPPPHPPGVVVMPTVNNLPMYINAGGLGGPITLITPANSSVNTQYLVRATGGGGGATRGKGGGGAGGTVILGLTNLASGTTLDIVIGGRGLGSDTIGSGGVSHNGGDTTLSIGGVQLIWAMGGVSPMNSIGGGPGGDPTFDDYDTNYIVSYSAHAIAGGDGDMWNGYGGAGGSSYWGGGNYGGSGGADGAGGGATAYSGFSGACGMVELTRISN